MSISRRESKQQKIEEIKNKFEESKAIIFHNFHHIDNENFFLLKKQLKENAKADYKVFKNNLIEIAINSSIPGILEKNELELNSANGIIFCKGEDKYESLKILDKFDQEVNDGKSKINWGIYNQKFVSKEILKKWANLPSKNESLQSFCYYLNYPLICFINLLKKIPELKKQVQ